MKNVIASLSILLILFSCAAHQNKFSKKTSAENEVSFNQKLADSLEADKYGMKNYFLVILKTGAKDKQIIDKKLRAEMFQGHFSNMHKMEKSGKLKLAGPFSTTNHLGYRGIFLLDAKTEDEINALLLNDPTIKSGIFEVEILPWYGSAAIPMHLPYHQKIAKENP